MSELIVFCNPQQVYEGKLEQDIAREYTKMAIDDYDKLISFDEKYMPFVETPDYEFAIGKKGNRNLLLTLFAQQPMTRVGDVYENFKSSSYLFNPESKEGLCLPDLDVIQIEGNSQVRDAAKTIKQFYENFGWETYIFDGRIEERIVVNPISERYDKSIEIIPPEILREIAEETVEYDLEELCF